MTDPEVRPAAAPAGSLRSRRCRTHGLALGVAALAVAANLAVTPYYAVRSDDPATLHAALGVRPAWSPPTAGDAFLALQRRFPDRVGGDIASLSELELGRLYLVRRNAVRSVLHGVAGMLLVAAAVLVERRRRRGATS